MKRLLLLFLTISFCLSIVKAQKTEFIKQEKNMLDFYSQKKMTDTTVNICEFREYDSFTIDEPWRVYSSTYNADSKLTSFIGKEFDTLTGLFVPFLERFYTSNMPNDSSMIEIINYAYSNPSNFKNEYFYSNNLQSYSLSYNWVDFVQDYVLFARGLNFYDNNNYLIKSVRSRFDGVFKEGDTVYYDNDIDGYMISKITKRSGSLAPTICGGLKKSAIIDSSFYNYDINHNILVDECYFYDYAITLDSSGLGDFYDKDTLASARKYTRTFNLNNELKSQLHQTFDIVTSTWINDTYEEHFFNSLNLDSLDEYKKWNVSLSAWQVWGYSSYEYNISGSLLNRWDYTLDVSTGDTLYTWLRVYNSNEDCSGVVVGIDENINNNEILIYPNPTTESITIDLYGIDTPLTYSLMNINGQIVKEGTSNTGLIIENLSSQSNGVYFLRAQTEGQIFNYKIIKQ